MDSKFMEIYNLYKLDIYRLIYSYTKNVYDTEDLVQNVFIKLYKNNKILLKDSFEIKRWLFKVAINECKSLFLISLKNKTIQLNENVSETIGIKEASSDDILSIIFNLPRKYRIVLYLYYYENYSIKEISKLLHLTETNTQTILSRARLKLKKLLKEDV